MSFVGLCSTHRCCACSCTPSNDGVQIEWVRDHPTDPCNGCTFVSPPLELEPTS